MTVLAVASLVWWLIVRDGTGSDAVVEVESQLTGTTTVVNVPYGAMTLNVTEPSRALPQAIVDVNSSTSNHWIGVSWVIRPSDVSTAQQFIGLDFDRTAEVVLIADGDRYDLLADQSTTPNATTPPHEKSVYVALPEAPAEVAVEVTYDGVTQRFSPGIRTLDTAEASGLYAAPTWTISAPECDNELNITAHGFEFLDGDSVIACEIREVTSTAYVEGMGWAQEGRSWLVVPILTNALNPVATWPALKAEPSELYRLKLRSTTAKVNGEPPAEVLSYYRGAPEALTGARYIFDVPHSGNRTLTFEQVYESDTKTSDVPGAPDQAAGTTSFSATLKQIP